MNYRNEIIDKHYFHRQLLVMISAIIVIIILIIDTIFGSEILGRLLFYQRVIIIVILMMFCNVIYFNIQALRYYPKKERDQLHFLSKSKHKFSVDVSNIKTITVCRDLQRIQENAQLILIKRRGIHRTICVKELYLNQVLFKKLRDSLDEIKGISVKKSRSSLLTNLLFLVRF